MLKYINLINAFTVLCCTVYAIFNCADEEVLICIFLDIFLIYFVGFTAIIDKMKNAQEEGKKEFLEYAKQNRIYTNTGKFLVRVKPVGRKSKHIKLKIKDDNE